MEEEELLEALKQGLSLDIEEDRSDWGGNTYIRVKISFHGELITDDSFTIYK